jgi:hypothetical protein
MGLYADKMKGSIPKLSMEGDSTGPIKTDIAEPGNAAASDEKEGTDESHYGAMALAAIKSNDGAAFEEAIRNIK